MVPWHVIVALAAFCSLSLALTFVCHLIVWIVARPTRVVSPGRSAVVVSVLKPLCGVDCSLRENLDGFARQTHEALQVVLGVADGRDEALPVAARFCRDHRSLETQVSLGEAPEPINPKVALLEWMSRRARGDWLVVSDSNVRVAPDYVARALRHASADVGLITHLVAGGGGSNLAARIENLQLSSLIAPGMCGARHIAGRSCVIGKSMFLRREALEAVGGFRAVGGFLAEDYAMGQAVEAAGFRVVMVDEPVVAWHDGWSFSRFFNRHLRWAVMRRRVSWLAYATELLLNPGPFLLALLALALTWHPLPVSVQWVVVAYWGAQGLAAATHGVMSGRRGVWGALLLNPLREVLAVGIWILGWFVQRIEWRGKPYRVSKGSRLEEAACEAVDGVPDEA